VSRRAFPQEAVSLGRFLTRCRIVLPRPRVSHGRVEIRCVATPSGHDRVCEVQFLPREEGCRNGPGRCVPRPAEPVSRELRATSGCPLGGRHPGLRMQSLPVPNRRTRCSGRRCC
jgi:hypothetical protein